MTGFRPALSLRGAKGRGAQGSAACGGVKRPQRLGRRLRLRKQRAAQMLSANPEIRFQNVAIFQVFLKNGLHEGERIAGR